MCNFATMKMLTPHPWILCDPYSIPEIESFEAERSNKEHLWVDSLSVKCWRMACHKIIWYGILSVHLPFLFLSDAKKRREQKQMEKEMQRLHLLAGKNAGQSGSVLAFHALCCKHWLDSTCGKGNAPFCSKLLFFLTLWLLSSKSTHSPDLVKRNVQLM